VSMRPPAPPTSTTIAAPLAATLAPKGGGAVTLVWQPEVRRLTALAPELPLSAGHDYELWVLPKQGKSRSLGLLKAGANRQLVMSADVAAQLGPDAIVAISLEPTGGSPTGQATGPVIAVGKISAS
ncbi:MAG: anti-sigma factor, partial [Novosphingobium sp.]